MVELFPTAKKRKQYAILANEFATFCPIAWAIKDHTAEKINCFIIKVIIPNYGIRNHLVTDRAMELVGETLMQNLKSKNIKHSFDSPYHPQAIGRVKRLSGILISTLEKIMDNKNKNTWLKYLKHALLVA